MSNISNSIKRVLQRAITPAEAELIKQQTDKIITYQPGYQEKFLSSEADIVIGGGAAGVGKTFSLLVAPLKNIHVRGFECVIFRREFVQIQNAGGLWDASQNLYLKLTTPPQKSGKSSWIFTDTDGSPISKISFKALQLEKNVYDWQGTEIAMLGFDELTHFSESQFFYMLSRNRTTCGIRPRVYATCNPEPESWLKKFIQWWVYPDDYPIEHLQGMPIPERNGKLRYFTRQNDEFVWGDTPDEVLAAAPDLLYNKDFVETLRKNKIMPTDLIKSVTFVGGDINQNAELLSKNPEYLANLYTQSEEERSKLLGGCWKKIDNKNALFKYSALQDIFTSSFLQSSPRNNGKNARDRYMTCDIALEGNDKFVAVVWYGWVAMKIYTVAKSGGDTVINMMKQWAKEWAIPQSNIAFDADGVGGFVGGFLQSAYAFKGNGVPINKENYANLRAQMYYTFAKKVAECEVYISDDANQQQIVREFEATNKAPTIQDGKLRIVSKDDVKRKLKGVSPDFADALVMRCVFELKELAQPKNSNTFEAL